MTLEITGTTQSLLYAEAKRQETDPEILARRLLRLSLLTKQRDVSHLAGTWTQTEAEEFERSTADFRFVTPSFFTNPNRPLIVCLCGSTRFYDMFSKLNLEETLAGKVVLSIASDRTTENEIFASLTPEQLKDVMQNLATLHFQKIDLADEILVVNVDGYVGESTTEEVNYALKTGKKVRWLEPDKIPDHLKI